MTTVLMIIQIGIALGIFNVWLLRYGKPTSWRAGEAKNMTQEFQVYGLPAWSVGVIGFLKVALAALLILGLWLPAVTTPAAIGLAILMLGAVVMHVKVKDPLMKSLPALSLLILCLIVALL